MSFQLCGKCKGLWTFFGTGVKPEVCPKCVMDVEQMNAEQMQKLNNHNNLALIPK